MSMAQPQSSVATASTAAAVAAPAADAGPHPGPVVILLGPSRSAVSGVSTHVNSLFASPLAKSFNLRHFQVGSEGRREGPLRRLLRLGFSPLALAWRIIADQALLVHINTSLNRRAFWRDLAYLLVARACGARVIYQVHGGLLPQQFCAENHLPPSLLKAVLRLPEAIVLLAQCELAAYRKFVPEVPVAVLPNGIDCAPYLGLERHEVPQSEPLRLVYIGRLAREKGLFEAVEGFAQALEQGLAARLTIAGSGPEEAALKALVAERGLAERVSFPGPVFGAAKLDLLAASDLLLLPTYAEGLPYTLLESMAAGVPPITTEVGAIPDVVTEGVHGLFVPPRDPEAIAQALMLLAANRPGLERMRGACLRRIVQGYSIAALAGEFARLYRAVCYLGRVRRLSES